MLHWLQNEAAARARLRRALARACERLLVRDRRSNGKRAWQMAVHRVRLQHAPEKMSPCHLVRARVCDAWYSTRRKERGVWTCAKRSFKGQTALSRKASHTKARVDYPCYEASTRVYSHVKCAASFSRAALTQLGAIAQGRGRHCDDCYEKKHGKQTDRITCRVRGR